MQPVLASRNYSGVDELGENDGADDAFDISPSSVKRTPALLGWLAMYLFWQFQYCS